MEEEESKIMGLKQDFVLRRLEDQGRFLARLILGKDEAHYELPEYEAMDNRADALTGNCWLLWMTERSTRRKTSFWMNWIPEI